MQNVPQMIKGVSHPFIADMYLKEESHNADVTSESVLVIQTIPQEEQDTEFYGFDGYLISLLTDLEDLKAQAESQIGEFDRVDIRT